MSNGKQPFFAQKFIRLLTKTASALELGPGGCWMLAVIVSQEDAKRYSEPAKWYYSQLMPLCGFNSPKQMRSAIQKAVDLGWLKYTPGRKGLPCYFSVRIPQRFANIDPSGCDETEFALEFTSESETKTETNNEDSFPNSTPKGERKRKRKGHASIPSPNPNPNMFDLDESFGNWYEIYPRKVARNLAKAAYKKAVQEIAREDHVDELEASLLLMRWTKERLPAINNQLKQDGDFRPHPATWLNGGRYRDAIATAKPVSDRPELRKHEGSPYRVAK